MRAEVVGVGTEILLGQIANSNARWISERLADIGVDVWHHQVVGDNLERIVASMRLALERADVVITTGGLGPTQDDITRDAFAQVLGSVMVRHSEIEEMLRAKFSGYGRGDMPPSNLRQADVPEGATYIMPKRGTAPGLAAQLPGGRRLYAVPGVPAEMREMLENPILPWLRRLSGSTLVSRTIRCTGIGESLVAEILDDLFRASANPSVAYLASSGEVKVRLTAKAPDPNEAEAMLAPIVDEIAARLGDVVFTTRDETLEEAVGRLLSDGKHRLACAESITGGGLGQRITDVAGISEVFAGSAVCYTAESKRALLGVSQATIDGPGVVSRECAAEMAEGARRIFDADLGLSTTGAAGPEAHGGAPPGTVWIALDADGVRHARGIRLPGERDRVRRWTEQAALDLVRRQLEGRRLPDSDRVI
jgi:competence/damage-inducible protein CinA-like protein